LKEVDDLTPRRTQMLDQAALKLDSLLGILWLESTTKHKLSWAIWCHLIPDTAGWLGVTA
jgi:hypothetical protein